MSAQAEHFLMTRDRVTQVAPGVFTLGAQGNSLAVETEAGIVLVDTGPGGEKTDRMIASLRTVSDRPLLAIVYSHGHVGYNFGVDQWIAHAAQRGDPRPRILAHARLPARYRRYRETAGLQAWLNTRQFRTWAPADMPAHWYRMPDETYDSRMVLHGGDRDVELIHAPSETDDVTAVWVPSERLLYGSAAAVKALPNVGTPLRTMRDPIRWAETLERLHALSPRILVPEFGAPVSDQADIDDCLLLPARVLRWLHKEVIDRMNRGMGVDDILHDIQYPAAWSGHKFLKQTYGTVDFVVRDIWRSENGWWDRNPTNLHPASPADIGTAVLSAIADPDHVLARARALAADGKPQLAMHVLDLLARGPENEACVREAQTLKAELCEALSKSASSYVSRQLYLSAADDLMHRPIFREGSGAIW